MIPQYRPIYSILYPCARALLAAALGIWAHNLLTTGLEPTTPGSPEESLATRLFPPDSCDQRREKVWNHMPSARAQGYKWDGTVGGIMTQRLETTKVWVEMTKGECDDADEGHHEEAMMKVVT
jgi:hypothetical protein